MGVPRNEKLKTLLETLPPHTVVTSKRLNVLNISPQHVQNYLKSGWVDAVAAWCEGDDLVGMARGD